MPRQRHPACTHCRESHLRCDRATPTCSNCRRARPPKECVLERLEIRESVYSTKVAREQMGWRAVADATGAIPVEIVSPQPNSVSPTQPDLQPLVPAAHAADEPQSHGSLTGSESLVPSSPPPSYFSPTSNSTNDHLRVLHTNTTTNDDNNDNYYPFGGTSPNGSRDSGVSRLITDPTEQYVFEFYINHAGPCLDIVSQRRHYACTIPKLALGEPVLYYACLAYASLLLHLNDGLDKAAHDGFQDRAIGELIPQLSHFGGVGGASSEALLATAVILRMAEQFSELAEDAQHHLRGAFSLFATAREKWSPAMTHVRGVTFWIYVRECIRASFLNEEAFRFDLDTIDIGFPVSADYDDEVWVNHVTYLLAKLCDACWGTGPDVEARAAMLERIEAALDTWHADLPTSFQPWHFRRRDCEAFPTVKLISPWHEVAWQQYYTCRVMLAVYGSSRPKSDAPVLEMNRYLETRIMDPARLSCGVCFSSPHIGCNFNGCHLIAWCGQFFTSREEQRILAKFLQGFTGQTSWPNRSCYDRLQDIWSGRRTKWV